MAKRLALLETIEKNTELADLQFELNKTNEDLARAKEQWDNTNRKIVEQEKELEVVSSFGTQVPRGGRKYREQEGTLGITEWTNHRDA